MGAKPHTDAPDDARETMRRVVENLDGEYGPKRNARSRDALDELVLTILSQQNSSASTRAVFAELKRRFPAWEDADAAPAFHAALEKAALQHKPRHIVLFLSEVSYVASAAIRALNAALGKNPGLDIYLIAPQAQVVDTVDRMKPGSRVVIRDAYQPES